MLSILANANDFNRNYEIFYLSKKKTGHRVKHHFISTGTLFNLVYDNTYSVSFLQTEI